MARKEKKINKVIGKTADGDFYCCEDIFRYSDNFKGATGTVLRPVSLAEYENAENPDNPDTRDRFLDLWKEVVQAGCTENGFDDWLKMLLATDFPECSFDVGGDAFWDEIRKIESDLTEEKFPIFDCIGCGRIFSKDKKFEIIYEPEILKQILRSEK
jgi:hypothetical protein